MKKSIYLFLTIILVFLLMLILHSFLELWFINGYFAMNGKYPETAVYLQLSSYLPPAIPLFLLAVTVFGGYFLGQTWWRIVYVEKRHWRFRLKKKGRR